MSLRSSIASDLDGDGIDDVALSCGWPTDGSVWIFSGGLGL